MNALFLMRYLDIGGTFILWILAFCSVLVAAVILERFYTLFRSGVDGEWLLRKIVSFLSKNQSSEASEFCKTHSYWSLAKIFYAGLSRANSAREAILEAMEISISQANRELEENLSILGTMAVIAPFIGLLGTVLGIIQAFQNIASQGKTGIETVGAGVAEALVTTAAGLFVAIFAVIAFNYFKSKIKRRMGEASDNAVRFSEVLVCRQKGIPFPEDLNLNIPGEIGRKAKSAGDSPQRI